MPKNLVGDWGSRLSDDDYSCAIAALGVLESRGIEQHGPTSDPDAIVTALREEFADGERTPVWRGAISEVRAGSWRHTVHADAAALAAGWRLYVSPDAPWRSGERIMPFHNRSIPRFAVPSRFYGAREIIDVADLVHWLSRPDVLPSAIVIEDGHAFGRTHWHWPLRVGVPDGPDDRHIFDTLQSLRESVPWIHDLSRCFIVGTVRDACDLLILSGESAKRLGEQPRARIRASAITVLDIPPLATRSVFERCSMIRAHTGAGAVATLDIMREEPNQLATFFRETLRELSHDVPVHAALTLASRFVGRTDPLIVGQAALLDAYRLLSIADQHDRVDAALAAEEHSRFFRLQQYHRPEPTFGGLAGIIGTDRPERPAERPPQFGSPPSHSIPKPLGDELRAQFFHSETYDGVRTMNEFTRREQARSDHRTRRWLQGHAWRDGRDIPARALEPERLNILTFHIGPSTIPLSGEAFPDQLLDFTAGDVELTVQLELVGAEIAPMNDVPMPAHRMTLHPHIEMAFAYSMTRPARARDDRDAVRLTSTTIWLPAVGDSTPALFAVDPIDGIEGVSGRVTVIHQNRVLQTARVSIDVAADADVGKGLVLAIDRPVHPRDDDLAERREYDAAIVVSDVGGKLHLTVQDHGAPRLVRLDDLAAPIDAIAKAIKQAAAQWDYSKPLAEQQRFDASLYAMAAHGSLIEQHLRKHAGDAIDHWERIQLVPTTNAYFPIEYVYDGAPPDVMATACPNMTSALDRGSCSRALGASDNSHPCPNRRSADFVCPLHFWGFQRMIERNTTSPAGLRTAPAGVTVPTKRPFGPAKGLLFAASDRAFQYMTDPNDQATERATLVQSFGSFGSISVADAADWVAWKSAAKGRPNLLVLVPHSDLFRQVPALEIGHDKWLGRQQIDTEVTGAYGDPQILLLLGCNTADVDEDFQPYPERFRDAGVSIVLAPIAAIRGSDAVPIAKRLTQLLAGVLAGSEPSGFAELLPVLRRQLLREGHPGVMSVVGFGDGDWLLGGA